MPSEFTIRSGESTCHAWHFEGKGNEFIVDGRRPCVVMAHGFSATKDSGLAEYAERMCAAGIDVVAFDYRGFGPSARVDQPAEVNPAAQVADYRAAISHARSLPDVDPTRIAVWGVSLSSGHVLEVAADDPSIAAVIAMTPAVDGPAAMRWALRRSPAASARLAVAAFHDAFAAITGGDRRSVAVVGMPGATALMTAPGADVGYARMAGPTAVNKVLARSLPRIAFHRPVRKATKITCPVLVQVADNDQSAPPLPARKAGFQSRAEVRHYPCDHFDVYPGSAWFDSAVNHQIHFLRRHLQPQSEFAPPQPLVVTS